MEGCGWVGGYFEGEALGIIHAEAVGDLEGVESVHAEGGAGV